MEWKGAYGLSVGKGEGGEAMNEESVCDTCGYKEGDGKVMIMGCWHKHWKDMRSMYTEQSDRTQVRCWYPSGSLDVIRDREERR